MPASAFWRPSRQPAVSGHWGPTAYRSVGRVNKTPFFRMSRAASRVSPNAPECPRDAQNAACHRRRRGSTAFALEPHPGASRAGTQHSVQPLDTPLGQATIAWLLTATLDFPAQDERRSRGMSAAMASSGIVNLLLPGPYIPPATTQEKRQMKMRSAWIMFLYHCPSCRQPGACHYGEGCAVGRELWAHILWCTDSRCEYRNCVRARSLLWHFWTCRGLWCPVCVPVRSHLLGQRS